MRICEPAENPHGLGQKTAVLNVDMPMRFQFSAWSVQKLPSCCYVIGNLDSKSGLEIGQQSIQSINQFTFYVFGTHQGSQQTITGKTVYTKR